MTELRLVREPTVEGTTLGVLRDESGATRVQASNGYVRGVASHHDGLVEGHVRHIVSTRGVPQYHRLSVDCHTDIVPLVLGLLAPSGPAAIRRLIMPVHVYPVQGMAQRRTRAHVSEKRGKVRSPTVTHPNTAPSVVREGRIARIHAAGLGAGPGSVFRRNRRPIELASNRGTVRDRYGRHHLSPQASAATSVACHELARWNSHHRAARAAAVPCRQAATFVRCAPHHCKPSEHVTDTIDERHSPILLRNDTNGCLV
jgi:hypothetical protein